MSMRSVSRMLFGLIFIFFFQAEDGIRDVAVTGVQTCALPISDALRALGVSQADGDNLEAPDRPVRAVRQRHGQRDVVAVGLDLADQHRVVRPIPPRPGHAPAECARYCGRVMQKSNVRDRPRPEGRRVERPPSVKYPHGDGPWKGGIRMTSASDLDTPAVTVDLDVMEANIRRVQAHLDQHDTANRPPIKTHQIPEIGRMQMAAGAVGITCQKLGEVEVFTDADVADDVLLTFNILGRDKTDRLMALSRRLRRLAVVLDNEVVARGLSEAGAAHRSE